MIGLALALQAATTQTIERGSDSAALLAPIVPQLDGMPAGALVTLLLRDVVKRPYVIAPDVLADRRPMSVRLVVPRNQTVQTVGAFLRRSGFALDEAGGVIFVFRPGFQGQAAPAFAPGFDRGGNLPLGSPLGPLPLGHVENAVADPRGSFSTQRDEGPLDVLAYIPAHRDPAYLAGVISPVLPKIRFGARGQVKGDADSATVLSRDEPDILVMSGSADDLGRARQLVDALDRPRPLVAVKAVVMQVSDSRARSSALSILASIAGGHFQLGSYPSDPPASQFVRIAAGASSAVLSAVRSDSRFKVVATPNLSALSGAIATINAGAQVPTIGSVVVPDRGAPVQSVTYRDSGITLTVRPVVRGELIELDVKEERSNFVRTTTGVSDSPTLQKSTASAQVVLKSGESVVLAGLTEQTETATHGGLFGGLLGTRSREAGESELIVLLQAEVVPAVEVPAGVYVSSDDKQG